MELGSRRLLGKLASMELGWLAGSWLPQPAEPASISQSVRRSVRELVGWLDDWMAG